MNDCASDEKLNEFIGKVELAIKERAGHRDYPHDHVLMAARNVGLGSAVMELSYRMLVLKIKEGESALGAIGYLIRAIVNLVHSSGRYQKGWIEDFSRFFVLGLDAMSYLPNPEDIPLDDATRISFGEMLGAVIALCEDREKVANVPLKKCVGYSPVKFWSQCVGWQGGFSFDDRKNLQALVAKMNKIVPDGDGTTTSSAPIAGDVAKLRERNEALQSKIRDLERQKTDAEIQRDKATRELERLRQSLKQQVGSCKSANNILASTQEEVDGLRAEIDRLKGQAIRDQEAFAGERDELRRQIAGLSDSGVSFKESVSEAVQPIYRQCASVAGKPMTVDLGEVMRTQLMRLFDNLKSLGVEI